VTRNLIRRIARVVFETHARGLPAGHWLVRLKTPFAPREFISARSQDLARAVRTELERLVAGIAARLAGGSIR
jgi:ribonuclease P protein component